MIPPDKTLDINNAKQMMDFEKSLQTLSNYTFTLLSQLEAGEELDNHTIEALETLHKDWLEAFVFEHRFYNSIESFTLEERSIFSSYGMQIFIELSRMHFLIHVYTWQEEQRQLNDNEDADPSQMSITWSLAMTKSRHWLEDNWPNWDKPVVQYTQSDIKFAIAYLCERVLDYPCSSPEAMHDFSTFLFILMTHNARFFCVQNTAEWLDIPEMRVADETDSTLYNFNRDYAMYRRYCTAYFGNALKRFYYYELFWSKRMPPVEFDVKHAGEMVKDWFVKVVCPSLGEEGFDECYTRIMDESYSCPGDDLWYSYIEPQGAISRGSVLSTLRPTLSKRYFSEERANVATVPDAAIRYKYGNSAREFVVEAVDTYISMHYSLKWRAGVVICHGDLETSQVKLIRAQAPLLVQAFSRYWAYDKISIWPTDSIYETIAIWFHQCKQNYRGRVFGVDLSKLIRQILDPERLAPQNLQGVYREI